MDPTVSKRINGYVVTKSSKLLIETREIDCLGLVFTRNLIDFDRIQDVGDSTVGWRLLNERCDEQH